jgi:putative phage-type endonuclease
MAYDVVCNTDDRAAWLKARQSGIGASEIAAACSESPWDSPFSLWARKARRLPEKDETEAMTWGRLLESVIIAEYGRRSGRHAEPHGLLLRSREHPWALATLDGTTTSGHGCAPWPLEIKNSSAHMAEYWTDGPPDHYVLQVHQQLLVTGARKATSACLLGGNRLVWCDIDRDERLIRKIVERGSDLWRHVQDGEPPEVDSSEATARALDQLYPNSEDKTLVLDADMMGIADEIESLKASTSENKKRLEELESRVKATLGSASSGILPDGREFTWKKQQRAAYAVKACEFRVLRLADKTAKKQSRRRAA